MRRLTVSVVLAALLAFGVAGASASVVSVDYTAAVPPHKGGGSEPAFYTLRYGPAGSQELDATVRGEPGRVRITDSVPIQPGARCSAVTQFEVLCERPDERLVLNVGGGQGSDTLRLSGDFSSPGHPELYLVYLRGGGGDDELFGPDTDASGTLWVEPGGGTNRFHGGAAGEFVHSEGVADVIETGTGDDYIVELDSHSVAYGPDTLDGGPGRDEVRYSTRPADRPLTVDLALGTGGFPGEGDVLRGIENVSTQSDSVVYGDGGPNRLMGGRVYGRDGDDHLIAGTLRDGGAGDDVIDFANGGVGVSETICGPGRDLVARPGPQSRIGPDCEELTDSSPWLMASAPAPRVPRQPTGFTPAGDAAVFKIPCRPSLKTQKRCYVRADLGDSTDGRFGSRTRARWVSRKKIARIVVPLTTDERAALANGTLRTQVRFESRPKQTRDLPRYMQFSYDFRQAVPAP